MVRQNFILQNCNKKDFLDPGGFFPPGFLCFVKKSEDEKKSFQNGEKALYLQLKKRNGPVVFTEGVSPEHIFEV